MDWKACNALMAQCVLVWYFTARYMVLWDDVNRLILGHIYEQKACEGGEHEMEELVALWKHL